MGKKILVLSAILVVTAIVAIAILFVQQQFNIMQNANSSLQAENNNLQDENRNLRFEKSALENQNDELVKQIGDLTKQLAITRPHRIEISTLSPEDHWSDYGSVLGVPRARNVFNVTVRNNDVVAVSGLELTVETLSGNPGGVGSWVFQNRIDLLRVGEERVIVGESIVPIDSLKDLVFVATIKSGDTIVDEFRLPLNEVSIQ